MDIKVEFVKSSLKTTVMKLRSNANLNLSSAFILSFA